MDQDEQQDELVWLIPEECVPGQIVGVHFLWSPFPEAGSEWYAIPPEPMCSIYGEFVPIARVDNGGVPDRVMANCCTLMKGVVGLFQEDEEYITVVVKDQEYFMPRRMPKILCEWPENEPEDDEEREG